MLLLQNALAMSEQKNGQRQALIGFFVLWTTRVRRSGSDGGGRRARFQDSLVSDCFAFWGSLSGALHQRPSRLRSPVRGVSASLGG